LKHKEKWSVQNLLARRKQQVLRRWLREVEALSDIEKMVCICEPETGETLIDEERRSSRDLVDC
jgi:hypothetical protein